MVKKKVEKEIKKDAPKGNKLGNPYKVFGEDAKPQFADKDAEAQFGGEEG